MLIVTDTVCYVMQFKEDGTYKSWVWDCIPEGATHYPRQHLNTRWYKFDGKKWYRWSSSYPVWDFCGNANMNCEHLEAL